jgi:hypothetical protein
MCQEAYMADKVIYPKVAKRNLGRYRDNAALTMQRVANYFGLKRSGRQLIPKWEAGISRPRVTRRSKFITYLADELKLRDDPATFLSIWGDLQDDWGWEQLSHAEMAELGFEPDAKLADKMKKIGNDDLFTVSEGESIHDAVSAVKELIRRAHLGILALNTLTRFHKHPRWGV